MTSNFIWRKTLEKYTLPPSDLTGSEWADKCRVVPAGTSPEPGPWRTSRTPYLKEPVDAATDRQTEIVVMEFSSQLGKSEALLNVIGYFADQEPAPQLMLQPTVEMAEAFSKERIEPMFQASPGLVGKLEEGKDGRGSAKKSSTTIRMKHYLAAIWRLSVRTRPQVWPRVRFAYFFATKWTAMGRQKKATR